MPPAYVLTDEGRRYLADGLPEDRLVQLLAESGGRAEREAIQKHMPKQDFAIALQWAKKKGYIEFRDTHMVLTSVPQQATERDALEELADNGAPEPFIIETLLQRRLITEAKQTTKQIHHAGQEVAAVTESLITSGAWKQAVFREYNVEVPGKKIHIGKRQPYSKFLAEVRRKLVELGFIEMTGPTITTEFWNFDALYQPQNHPSRDWTQTYSLKYPKNGSLPSPALVKAVASAHEKGAAGGTGWGYHWSAEKAAQLTPIAHDTAISPQTLVSKNLQIPGKYFQIVRCYRPDVIDATHLVEFNQMGGFLIGEDLNFRDLLGLLKMFALEFGEAKKVRFLPDYYPFTEPSVQMSALHPKLGWVELGGAGMFREEMVKPLGIDVPVIAWGIGIDRIAMYKLGINDVRDIFSQNLEWLRSQVVR